MLGPGGISTGQVGALVALDKLPSLSKINIKEVAGGKGQTQVAAGAVLYEVSGLAKSVADHLLKCINSKCNGLSMLKKDFKQACSK